MLQFGSSSQAVFFKMRVAGVLHIFQFDTRQGEDICMALQTHINDIMMKRYSKARAQFQSPQACANTDFAFEPEMKQAKLAISWFPWPGLQLIWLSTNLLWGTVCRPRQWRERMGRCKAAAALRQTCRPHTLAQSMSSTWALYRSSWMRQRRRKCPHCPVPTFTLLIIASIDIALSPISLVLSCPKLVAQCLVAASSDCDGMSCSVACSTSAHLILFDLIFCL